MSNKKNTKTQSKFLSVVKEWAWAIAIALLGVAIIIFVAVSSCAGSTDIKPSPYAQSTTPEVGDFTPAADGQQTELPAEGEEIAVLETSKGVIKLRLFPEQTPLAYENFT
ncbi:MAG: hypothetical protein IJP17_04990, partial [Clostridia bacterium]|nr:hypothetical protein [Clostridia bacterium]